jgi:low temperature requirement protein LtrA
VTDVTAEAEPARSKRVSWVELYFDLVFVLAVSQVAHVIAEHPTLPRVWTAAGLFVVLWWTWIGFATLYNRHGDESSLADRALIVVAAVPCGVAAVGVNGVVAGDVVPFAVGMAAARALLAIGHLMAGVRVQRTIAASYAISAAVFAVSIAVPSPWRYWIWGVAVLAESANLLERVRHTPAERRADRARNRALAEADPAAPRRSRRFDLSRFAPSDPSRALDAGHFSERFGLFMVILIGEVVASTGQGLLGETTTDVADWVSLATGIVLAGALWWLYFDSAAEISERLLKLSGGSPALARQIFGIGQMIPAFALILIAAGAHELVAGEGTMAVYRVAGYGLAIYLASTRVLFAVSTQPHVTDRVLRVVVIVAGFFLPRLGPPLGPHWYLAALAAWAVICAVLGTLGARGRGDWIERLTGGATAS